MKKHYEPIVCEDGFTMSVQASQMNYAYPRTDSGPYSQVEIGYPSQEEPLLIDWAEDPGDPTGTVYGWVPSSVVWDVILKHGGVTKGELPPLVMGE